MTTDTQKELLRILGFANGYANVVADIGNARGKLITDRPVMRGNNPLNFVDFTHAVVETNYARWSEMLSYRSGKSAYDLIGTKGRYYVVGDYAHSLDPDFDPLVGRAKYTRDYYGILFLSGLCQLFQGNPPENVNVYLAHPPRDREYKTELMKAVVGKWDFYCGSEHHRINVAYVNTFEEVVGGVMNFTLGVDGEKIEGVEIIGDGPTLVFDLGGGSLDMVRLKKDGSIDYEYGLVSHPLGVNKAVTSFKQLFDQKYRDYLDDAENGFPRDLILDIFMDPKHQYRAMGETFDCKTMYETAIAPIIRQSRDHVRAFTHGRLSFNRVLLDGGGTALMYDDIVEKVFPEYFKNKVVHNADSRKDLFKANAKGALKMIPSMQQVSVDRARRYAKEVGIKYEG